MGTEEEERRLSNSEKSSLDVPLDAFNRSKLPERRDAHTNAQGQEYTKQTVTKRQPIHTKTNGSRQYKYE